MLYLSYLSHSLLYESSFSSRLEIFNEVVFLFLCYHMVLFANLVTDFEVREYIGWSFIYSSLFLVGVNTLVIMGVNVMTLLLKCKRKFKERKQKKLIKEFESKKAKQWIIMNELRFI